MQPTAWEKPTAFFGLVTVQVCLAYAFKWAQVDGQYPFNAAGLLVLSEACKGLLSFALLSYQLGNTSPSTILDTVNHVKQQISASSGIVKGCLTLALLYALNNNASFILFQWADGANINLVKGGSSFISTLLLRVGFGREFTEVQWVAVCLQVCGLVVSQFGANANDVPALMPMAYLVLLASVTVTSVCSVVNDALLKSTSSTASMHTLNMLMYAGGVVFNGFAFFVTGGTVWTLFQGLDSIRTWPVLVLNTVIGIIISALYKYADATTKTFASACAVCLLYFLDFATTGKRLRIVVIMGCMTVFLATHLFVQWGPAKIQSLVKAGAASAGGHAATAPATQPDKSAAAAEAGSADAAPPAPRSSTQSSLFNWSAMQGQVATRILVAVVLIQFGVLFHEIFVF